MPAPRSSTRISSFVIEGYQLDGGGEDLVIVKNGLSKPVVIVVGRSVEELFYSHRRPLD